MSAEDSSTQTPVLNNSKTKQANSSWQDAAARKRDHRTARMQRYPQWGLGDLLPLPSQKNVVTLAHARLTDRERSFLALDVTSLIERLASQECSAVEVTTAFCKAAYAAQELTNCLTEIMFDSALARAKELDDHLAKTGKVVGPLHGVPISIKDCISVKGEDTATGYTAWAGKKIAEQDATVVGILRAAGAVFYVKTTNPIASLAPETISNIYGTTKNPFNRDLTSCGSSGGEGALIASRGSLLGVGSDIGGSLVSVSLPASAQGLYTLVPSARRFPVGAVLETYKGMDNINGAFGPLARSARDIELYFRVVSQSRPWETDYYTLPMPWNSDIALNRNDALPKRLVIGLMSDDGIVAPHPPIASRLNKTRDALLAAGHEVIEWEPMEQLEAVDLAVKLVLLDGGKAVRDILAESGEPATPILQGILGYGEKFGLHTLAQSWEANVQRDEFRARALKHWNATATRSKQTRPIDALLTPAAATLAPPHGTTKWLGYSIYWNLIDHPALVFPSGKPLDATTWDSSQAPEQPAARNPVEEVTRAEWNPETYHGAPVGLQLVGQLLQEEKLLGVLNVIEDAVSRFEKQGNE